MDFFDRANVNLTSYAELEDEEGGGEEKQEDSPNGDDKTLTVLQALLERMGRSQIFRLPEEMRQCTATAFHHLELYADNVKDV